MLKNLILGVGLVAALAITPFAMGMFGTATETAGCLCCVDGDCDCPGCVCDGSQDCCLTGDCECCPECCEISVAADNCLGCDGGICECKAGESGDNKEGCCDGKCNGLPECCD